MKSPASFSRRAGWPQRPFKLAYPATHSASEFDLLTRFVRIIDTQSDRCHGFAALSASVAST